MNTVRTTIAFDPDLHQLLVSQAANMGLSLSGLVNKKLSNANSGTGREAMEKQIAKDLAFFKSLGKKLGNVDWIKALREERDRDNS